MTTDPASLAVKIAAIDEVTGASGASAHADYSARANYNVAPTTPITTVVARHGEPGDDPTRRVRLMRWGLLPPWVKPGPDGAPDTRGPLLINARAETVATSPAFRNSAHSRRALVPMDGWYEWRPDPDTGKSPKTPFFMHRGDGGMLFMAGLWSAWKPSGDADPLWSCAIITTEAVGELAEVHHRMPYILAEEAWDPWLDPDAPLDPELLAGPPDVRGVEVRRVSTLVNSVGNNGPELLDPV